jgi:tripartite-type tricarboxylate transporter receptor subunit TctC
MSIIKSFLNKIFVSSIVLLMSVTFASAQVTNIIPFGPGGESDVTARMQQPFYKSMFKDDVVVQYKPGGGGSVGWQSLNSEKADGSVIMGVNLPHIIMQPIAKKEKAGYKTDDLKVFAFFHYTPDAILVEASSPYKSLKDLLDFAKKNPGKLTFSGSGTYSANHLLTIALNQKANIKTTYVPFKGTGASVQALLGKQVVASAGYSTVAAKQGSKVRMLAVASEKRLPAFPNVPTFKELGYDIVSGAYRGYALPKSASAATVKTWSDRIMKINADPSFKKKMEDGAFVVVNIGHDKIDSFMAEQKKANEKIAKELGLIK